MSRTLRHSLHLASALAILLPVVTTASEAQTANLGGGFIEFLVTGRSGGPAQYAPPMQAPPPAARRPGYATGLVTGSANYIPDDPAEQQPGPRRTTAPHLAPTPETGFDPRYERQTVDYTGPHRAGTVVVDTPNKFLYLVQGNGKAIRYGIGVGRPGFEWAGSKSITRKAEWPDWRPPSEMLKRRPDLPTFMAGGIDNPLGARALYLGSSLYRIHGTNEPSTIGQAVSSGCIRMRNEDVTDLYERVRVGTHVVVI